MVVYSSAFAGLLIVKGAPILSNGQSQRVERVMNYMNLSLPLMTHDHTSKGEFLSDGLNW